MPAAFRRHIILFSFAALVSLAGLVSGCSRPHGSEHASAQGGDPRVLTAAIGYPEPHTVFAPGGGGGGPGFTGSKVLERLARFNKDQTYSPVLASGWTIAPDGRSIDLELRQGVKWHDGKDFTADDVAYSITQYWKPLSPGGVLDYLSGVEVTNPHHVVVRFSRPVPDRSLLRLLAGATNYILPKHIYAGTNVLLNPANNAPIGTGPWVFSKWVRGSYVEFHRNPSYWKPGEPKLDRLIIRWWRDPASRAAALETGALDVGVGNPVPLADIARLRANPKLKVEFENDGEPISIWFNTKNPIVSDRRVRQALLLAIDRNFIAKTIYYGFAKPGVGPILSNNKQYFTPDTPRYDYDPAKAASLLDAAGYPVKSDGKRFKLNLLASGWSEENGKVGAYLKQVFQDLHIDVTFRVPDRANSLKALYTDYDFDVAYSQGGGTASEVTPEMSLIFGKAGISKGLIFRNASRYSTPEMESLLERISVELNPTKRATLIHQFAQLAGTDVPSFPLVEWNSHIITQSNVHLGNVGWSASSDSWGDVSKVK